MGDGTYMPAFVNPDMTSGAMGLTLGIRAGSNSDVTIMDMDGRSTPHPCVPARTFTYPNEVLTVPGMTARTLPLRLRVHQRHGARDVHELRRRHRRLRGHAGRHGVQPLQLRRHVHRHRVQHHRPHRYRDLRSAHRQPFRADPRRQLAHAAGLAASGAAGRHHRRRRRHRSQRQAHPAVHPGPGHRHVRLRGRALRAHLHHDGGPGPGPGPGRDDGLHRRAVRHPGWCRCSIPETSSSAAAAASAAATPALPTTSCCPRIQPTWRRCCPCWWAWRHRSSPGPSAPSTYRTSTASC